LRDYARVLIDGSLEADFPGAILALERNWKGQLALNDGVEDTLDRWKKLETLAKSDVAANWRFQAPLLRANYDAYIQKRLNRETDIAKRLSEQAQIDAELAGITALSTKAQHAVNEIQKSIAALLSEIERGQK